MATSSPNWILRCILYDHFWHLDCLHIESFSLLWLLLGCGVVKSNELHTGSRLVVAHCTSGCLESIYFWLLLGVESKVHSDFIFTDKDYN